MIQIKWDGMAGEIQSMMNRFQSLPRHIAKKHLVAAMRRALKEGEPILKRNTPVGRKLVRQGIKRSDSGTFTRGSQKIKSVRVGNLRRAVTTRAKYIGRNSDGSVVGTLGYKFGFESRKAIWLEFGTSRGLDPRAMVQKTMSAYAGPAVSKLVAEMATALDKAVRELEGGKNPRRV